MDILFNRFVLLIMGGLFFPHYIACILTAVAEILAHGNK
jgi:hypothetical protein